MSTQRARGGRKRQNKTPQRGEEVTFEASTDHVAWNLGPHLQNKPLVLFLLPVPRMRRERKGKGPTTAVESLSYPPGNDGSRGRERPTATATATSFDRCFLSLSLSPPSLVRSLSTLMPRPPHVCINHHYHSICLSLPSEIPAAARRLTAHGDGTKVCLGLCWFTMARKSTTHARTRKVRGGGA